MTKLKTPNRFMQMKTQTGMVWNHPKQRRNYCSIITDESMNIKSFSILKENIVNYLLIEQNFIYVDRF